MAELIFKVLTAGGVVITVTEQCKHEADAVVEAKESCAAFGTYGIMNNDVYYPSHEIKRITWELKPESGA